MLPIVFRGLLVLSLLSAMTGCEVSGVEGADTDDTDQIDATSEGRVFQGTVVDHAEAMAACYERRGWAVERDPDDPTIFHIDAGVIDDGLMQQAVDDCLDEVGFLTTDSYPDGYLESMYKHKQWQRECLIDLGYDPPPPPSFDAYAESLDWDPVGQVMQDAGIRGLEAMRLQGECPHFHRWEAQQSDNGG